jgi:hypothetical protein
MPMTVAVSSMTVIPLVIIGWIIAAVVVIYRFG